MGFFTYLKHSDNNILDALIIGATENANFPANNLKALPISKPYRSTDGSITGQKIRIDYPFSKNTDQVALINHNLSPTATITLNGGTTPDPDGGEFTTPITWRETNAFINLSATQTFENWAILIEDESNTFGFINAGYIGMGMKTTFDFGFNFGWQFSDRVVNIELETEFGAKDIAAMYRRVILSLIFEHLTETQGTTLRDFYLDLQRNSTPFFLVPDVSVNDGYFGRITNELKRTISTGKRVRAPIVFQGDSLGKVIDQLPTFHFEV